VSGGGGGPGLSWPDPHNLRKAMVPCGTNTPRGSDPPGQDPSFFTGLRHPVGLSRRRLGSRWRESRVHPLGPVPVLGPRTVQKCLGAGTLWRYRLSLR
jgi:hypothetical protein